MKIVGLGWLGCMPSVLRPSAMYSVQFTSQFPGEMPNVFGICPCFSTILSLSLSPSLLLFFSFSFCTSHKRVSKFMQHIRTKSLSPYLHFSKKPSEEHAWKKNIFSNKIKKKGMKKKK